MWCPRWNWTILQLFTSGTTELNLLAAYKPVIIIQSTDTENIRLSCSLKGLEIFRHFVFYWLIFQANSFWLKMFWHKQGFIWKIKTKYKLNVEQRICSYIQINDKLFNLNNGSSIKCCCSWIYMISGTKWNKRTICVNLSWLPNANPMFPIFDIFESRSVH